MPLFRGGTGAAGSAPPHLRNQEDFGAARALDSRAPMSAGSGIRRRFGGSYRRLAMPAIDINPMIRTSFSAQCGRFSGDISSMRRAHSINKGSCIDSQKLLTDARTTTAVAPPRLLPAPGDRGPLNPEKTEAPSSGTSIPPLGQAGDLRAIALVRVRSGQRCDRYR